MGRRGWRAEERNGPGDRAECEKNAVTDKRSGEFMSDATAWDHYVGSKDWNALTTAQQDVVLVHETYSGANFDPRNFIAELDFLKAQAAGITAILTTCYIVAEQSGLKAEARGVVWDENARWAVSLILNRTAFGKRLDEAWSTLEGSESSYRTHVSSAELAAVAQRNLSPSPLGALLGMEWTDAQEQITRFLSPALPRDGRQSSARLSVVRRPWRDLSKPDRAMIVAAAEGGDTEALDYVARNRSQMRPNIMAPHTRTYSDPMAVVRWEEDMKLYERAGRALKRKVGLWKRLFGGG